MTKNHRLMQHQSDLLNKAVKARQRDTCWGVAKGVLTSLGIQFKGFENEMNRVYEPVKESAERVTKKYEKWHIKRNKYYDLKQE